MIQQVVNNLKSVDNSICEKLISIITGSQNEVSDDFYTSTIFESQKKYNELIDVYATEIKSKLNINVWNTPLCFVRGKATSVFNSSPKQGVDFGTSKPI